MTSNLTGTIAISGDSGAIFLLDATQACYQKDLFENVYADLCDMTFKVFENNQEVITTTTGVYNVEFKPFGDDDDWMIECHILEKLL